MLDITAIFQYFGLNGDDQSRRQAIASLQIRMKAAGRSIGFKAAEQWFLRKQIPSKHLVSFAYLAKREGRKFDLTKFLTKKKAAR